MYKDIADISLDLLFLMIRKSRVLDFFFFDSRLLNCLLDLFHLNDQSINKNVLQIYVKISKRHPKDSIVFWDFMKNKSDNLLLLESVSEYIYYETNYFNLLPEFNYQELFNIMTIILSKNNPIANGNILMSIREGVDNGNQMFTDFFINESFIQTLLHQANYSHLKSIKREAIVLLTSFISKLSKIQDISFPFPFLRFDSILKLLNDQMLVFPILRYLNSIAIYHPYEFFSDKLPPEFNIFLLIYEIMKKCVNEIPFKIKTEASLLIARFIDQDVINGYFLSQNYIQIFNILFDFINSEPKEAEFLIIILIKVCSELITIGIKKEIIRRCFDENDAQKILDDCIEKSTDLVNCIQSLTLLICA